MGIAFETRFDYNNHFLVFKRSHMSRTLEVWRYTQDMQYEQAFHPFGLYHREPEVLPDDRQYAVAHNASADAMAMGRNGDYLAEISAYRGQFSPWILLDLPEGSFIFKVRASRIIFAFTRSAVVYDAYKGTLIQTFDIGTTAYDVDLAGPHHVLIGIGQHLIIYACDTGSPLLDVPEKVTCCVRDLVAKGSLGQPAGWRKNSMLAPLPLHTRNNSEWMSEDLHFSSIFHMFVQCRAVLQLE